jgi:hypothetical protein
VQGLVFDKAPAEHPPSALEAAMATRGYGSVKPSPRATDLTIIAIKPSILRLGFGRVRSTLNPWAWHSLVAESRTMPETTMIIVTAASIER